MSVDPAVDEVADWVGNTVDTAVIAAALNRTSHDPHRAALSILRRRRMDLVDDVQSWRVDGDYSESKGSLIRRLAAVDDQIGRLERITGDTDGRGLDTVTSTPIRPLRGHR